jgi:hypothetical protein
MKACESYQRWRMVAHFIYGLGEGIGVDGSVFSTIVNNKDTLRALSPMNFSVLVCKSHILLPQQ